MSLRLEALKEICKKYPYQKRAQKLTEEEFDDMVQILEDHDHLDHLGFEYAMNRKFIGKKRKSWTIVWDLLVSANSKVHVKPRNRTYE